MNTINTASSQWFKRPADERFISLDEMLAHFRDVRSHSRSLVASTAKLSLVPGEDNKLQLVGKAGIGYEPTHYSFGQLASLANGSGQSPPAGYLRTLPAPMAADLVNYGLIKRDIDEVGLLLTSNGSNSLRAATGPRYGRVWNSDVVQALIARFGNGVTGHWRVPGEFGKAVEVNRQNTTLYASDRDFFVFLADEERRIEVAGETLARGFFVWNSEVGAQTLGLATFLFRFVCVNRIIWGSQDYAELRIRHTVSAPDRFLEEVRPALQKYGDSSTKSIIDAVTAAKADRINDVDEFLAKRYGPQQVAALKTIHQLEENRPIETRWDVVNAVTARARSIEHQDSRVQAEREAGSLLNR